MKSYIIEARCIAKELVSLISSEEKELQQFNTKFQIVKKQISLLENEGRESNMHDNMNEISFQHSYRSFYSYDKEAIINLLNLQINQLETLLATKHTSVNSLCLALLQISQHGISTVRLGLSFCPNGRYFGNETLKNIIWQASNLSLQGNSNRFLNQSVIDCFNSLGSNFGDKLNIGDNNLPENIIGLLGWKVYSRYEQDMISLLGE